ncbi:unknown [Orgyia leucostigma nucleopolyhedrovirus]|uniref:Pif-6 n=1 Tax=Orgyia leucostigma nucleopolyhedrovirus TaxID=490711 RepID=B0FDT2_9ABAC|nr:unknown [Orgyia leucostigma nucleopolyhedrovirus]ABY65790.1 unknown [Orgyia leucostigma nucleopolyhedrovirus]
MVKWRMLNADRVEVTPEDRKDAWQKIIIDTLRNCPSYDTYRTLVNKANFDNFDYNRPIVYEIGNKTLLINSEFLNKSLNRPRVAVAAMNVKSFHIVLAFICAMLLTVITAFAFEDRATFVSPPGYQRHLV